MKHKALVYSTIFTLIDIYSSFTVRPCFFSDSAIKNFNFTPGVWVKMLTLLYNYAGLPNSQGSYIKWVTVDEVEVMTNRSVDVRMR